MQEEDFFLDKKKDKEKEKMQDLVALPSAPHNLAEPFCALSLVVISTLKALLLGRALC